MHFTNWATCNWLVAILMFKFPPNVKSSSLRWYYSSSESFWKCNDAFKPFFRTPCTFIHWLFFIVFLGGSWSGSPSPLGGGMLRFSAVVVSQITKTQLWKSPANLCRGPVIHEDTWDISGGFSRNMMSCGTSRKRGRAFRSIYTFITSSEGMVASWELNSQRECPAFEMWNWVARVHAMAEVWTSGGLKSP